MVQRNIEKPLIRKVGDGHRNLELISRLCHGVRL